ncbi:dystrophia myotonica WD repeat-containing protein isoform X3 [Canis lupus familiaris]|uniref:dystrophia myotonica WD repeat-containing protein isoform X3 n=1 Tax=Canis lupus familiaris TaxID=9615 RepID=UPI0018F52BCD|nr:dystrophia myotonica WD repeat-containing protein isoform X3 [Canis lupus familiaris]
MAAGGAEGGSGPGAAMGDCAEIKSQFRTREGFYKLLPGDGAARRSGPASAQTPAQPQPPQPPPGPASSSGPGAAGSAPSPPPAGPGPGPALPAVRLSLVRLGEPDSAGAGEPPATPAGLGAGGDRVCFNLGRELYFYPGCCRRGSQRSIDLNKPIDKRIYKGTQPTCHDFNQFTAATETISLLVGFSAGQVQYLDLIKKDTSKLFNEERLIDKTKVTYLKWLPESESLFLASHASGHLYLYNVSHPCASAPPQYSLLKQGEGFAVYAAKSKAPRNPLAKWAVGEGPLNEFAFSPDGRHLACVSQDGCLRVFHFDSMLLRGLMKSYFGGLLCVCWSPDGRYVVTGGEDDLVTVWSFAEGRVVARGHGHKSWVNAVAFDPYTTRAEEAAAASGDASHTRRAAARQVAQAPPRSQAHRSASAASPRSHCRSGGTGGRRKSTSATTAWATSAGAAVGAAAGGTSPAAPPPAAGWTQPRCWALRCARASTRCHCSSPSCARRSPRSASRSSSSWRTASSPPARRASSVPGPGRARRASPPNQATPRVAQWCEAMDVGVPHPCSLPPSHNPPADLTDQCINKTNHDGWTAPVPCPAQIWGSEGPPDWPRHLGGCSGPCGLSLVPTHCQVQ